MKRLIAVLLCVCASLLAVRVWQELPTAQGVGQPATQNGDVNGDTFRDIGDAVYILNWLFSDGDAPVALADSPDVLARLAALEAILTPETEPESYQHGGAGQWPRRNGKDDSLRRRQRADREWTWCDQWKSE